MIHSIRRFLFISLILAVTVALSITAIGNYLLDKPIINPSLDKQLIYHFIFVTLITYSLFAIFIWFIIGVALRSITRLSHQISRRAFTYLEPVNADNIPIEIKPLADKLNQLLKRLKLAFERNKRFAADTAHELRTPLAALKTQAQVALKTTHAAAQQQTLTKVMQGVDRCSHIVTQLLTLSSLGEEDALNDIRPVELYQLTREMLTYLVPLALEKKIDLELEPAPHESHILGNDIALGILMRNLVDNAIRYTPSHGAVTVAIMHSHHSIVWRITDTGPGIPAELRTRVFDRFYRVLGTTQSGSGLGLAIVRQIVELHHAHITLDTPANGIGLQIDIVFPTLIPASDTGHTQRYKKRRKRRNR